jgi:hypothetical protein
MLHEDERRLLNDLAQQLRSEDPSWARQFDDPPPLPAPPNRDLLLETAAGILALLAAFAVLLGSSAAAVALLAIAGVLAYFRYYR